MYPRVEDLIGFFLLKMKKIAAVAASAVAAHFCT